MKILQILTDTNIGGAGIWLLNFLKSYNRDKLEVSVVLPKGAKLIRQIEKLNVSVIEAENIADKSFSFSGIRTFKKIITDEKPDLIHTHACISARIAGRIKGVKIVNTRHCLEEKKSFPKNILYKFINNILSDRVIGVSEAVVNNLIYDGIKKNKVRLVYNGINPLIPISFEKKKEIREKYGFNESNVIIGIVARLEEVKNHDLFIRAAKLSCEKDSNLRFLIVGAGSLETKLKNKVKELNLDDKVVFAGYIQNVNDITNIIDISVITSYREALSIALIEGMSLGKACIATDSGGPSEVIDNGKSGIIVPNNDEKRLSSAILELSDDINKREVFGKIGKKIFEEKFGIGEMAQKIEDIYAEIAERKDEKNEDNE